MRLAALLVLAALRPWDAAAAQAKPLQGLDAYITRSMADWKVPGLAIAVVRNDSVVLAKGYGVRTLGRPERVDAGTLFAIGSTTKAFTATLVAMLVDEGKVKWDDPVTNYLADFRMYDPYVTRELTVRDLLTHRSGLARGDPLWYLGDLPRDSVLHRLRYFKPAWSFRSHFGYQNIMYVAAGQLAARAAGTSWDDLVRRRILTPLGMTGSNTSTNGLDRLPDVATPHAEVDDTVRIVPWHNIDNAGPAGSINSSVLEMAQWLRFQLAGGKIGGKPLVSAAAFGETHQPQTIIPREALKITAQEAHFVSYGMGWLLHDYRGREIIEHNGGIDGMSALVALLPEENTGLVILSNLEGNNLTYALMYRVFDAYLKQAPRDWSTTIRKADDEVDARNKQEEKNAEAQRVTGTSPSLPLDKYAGTYVDTLYGEATVRREGSGLVFRYGATMADLAHWQYDTFRATWRPHRLGKVYVTFVLDETGKVGQLRFPDLADFSRKPEVADTTPGVRLATAELARYTGSFGSPSLPVTAEVQLIGAKLKLTVPGQPVYTLVAVTATRFRLTGDGVPAGFFLDYAMEGGRVRQVTLVQPEPQPSLTLVLQHGAGR